MGGISKRLKGWYVDRTSESCHFCGSTDNMMPMYHPKPLAFKPGKGGVKLTVCRSCYSYYKYCGLDGVDLDLVEERLKNRPRRRGHVNRPAADLNDPMLAKHSDGTPVTMDEVFGAPVNLDVKVSDL